MKYKKWTFQQKQALLVLHFIDKKTYKLCAEILKRSEDAVVKVVAKIQEKAKKPVKVRRCMNCVYNDRENTYCSAYGKYLEKEPKNCAWHETITEYLSKCKRIKERKAEEERQRLLKEERAEKRGVWNEPVYKY